MWDLDILLPEPELRRSEDMGDWRICPTLATPPETPYAIVRPDGSVVSAHSTRDDAVFAVRMLMRAKRENNLSSEDAEKGVRAKVVNPTESRPRLESGPVSFSTSMTLSW